MTKLKSTLEIMAIHINVATVVWICSGDKNRAEKPRDKPKALARIGLYVYLKALSTALSEAIPSLTLVRQTEVKWMA